MPTSSTKKKATFVLDASLLATAQRFVQGEAIKSMHALVEQALHEFLAKLQAHEIQQALVAASTDPLFLADIHEVLRDFDVDRAPHCAVVPPSITSSAPVTYADSSDAR